MHIEAMDGVLSIGCPVSFIFIFSPGQLSSFLFPLLSQIPLPPWLISGPVSAVSIQVVFRPVLESPGLLLVPAGCCFLPMFLSFSLFPLLSQIHRRPSLISNPASVAPVPRIHCLPLPQFSAGRPSVFLTLPPFPVPLLPWLPLSGCQDQCCCRFFYCS